MHSPTVLWSLELLPLKLRDIDAQFWTPATLAFEAYNWLINEQKSFNLFIASCRRLEK